MIKQFGFVTSILVSSNMAFAEPVAFGLEIGVTTSAQVAEMYSVNDMGYNKWNNGRMVSVPTHQIGFDRLQSLTVIFGQDDKVSAILTKFPKGKFNYLHQALGGKYQVQQQNIPFVGNKFVAYRGGETTITLDAPHLSFEMSLDYISDQFQKVYDEKRLAEQRAKQANEQAQL